MRLLICLSNAELTLVITERYQVLRCQSLPVNADEVQLNDALAEIPAGVKVDIITDLMDEDRHTESIPRVMPWEQAGLLQRALRRHKGNDALFYSRWVGTEKNAEGRAEKKAHVVSLSDTRELNRLMAVLQALDLTLDHLYSLSELVAQACQSKGSAKKQKGRADILLIQTSPDSYRQMLVVDGITQLSRQVQLQSALSDELHDEQVGFERFIMVQRLVPFGQTFSYTLIAWDDAQLARFRQACSLTDETVVTERLIRKDRLQQAARLQSYPALALILEQYNRRKPPSHFQPPAFQAARKQRLTRQALSRSALLLFALALFQGVSVAVDTWNHQQVLQEMAQRERNYLSQARHYESLVDLPARADDVRDATLFVESILAHRDLPGLRLSLVEFSGVFAEFEVLRLRSLNWQRPTLEKLGAQQLVIDAEIPLTDQQSLKWLTGYLATLVTALEAVPAVQSVTRQRLPFEAEEGDSLSLNLDLEQDEPRVFPITITIELDYDPEPA